MKEIHAITEINPRRCLSTLKFNVLTERLFPDTRRSEEDVFKEEKKWLPLLPRKMCHLLRILVPKYVTVAAARLM